MHPLLGRLLSLWLLLARPLVLLLLVVVLLGCWLGWSLYRGRQASAREQAVIACAHELKSLTERYLTDYGASAASFDDIVAAYPDTALPANPYTGQPCAELSPGDELEPGNFTYLLLIWHDRIENSAVLVYSAAPVGRQGLYNRLFARRKNSTDPDLVAGKMEVVWIGGATDTQYEYLSRGLDPEAAVNKLRRLFQPATGSGERPDYTSLEVLTAQEYAGRLEAQP